MDRLLLILIQAIAAIIAMLLHEVPRNIVSHYVMHPIFRASNKINTKISQYIDPIGLIFFVVSYIGWQKPKVYDASKYRDKEKGVLIVALSGFLGNLIGMVVLIPIHVILGPNINAFVSQFIYFVIRYNFAIIIINLLPVPPLEMTNVIYYFSKDMCLRLLQNKRIIQIAFLVLIGLQIIPLMINNLFLLLGIQAIN